MSASKRIDRLLGAGKGPDVASGGRLTGRRERNHKGGKRGKANRDLSLEGVISGGEK